MVTYFKVNQFTLKKYIYLISDSNTYYYKIGISNNPEKRLKQLSTGNQSKLKIIHKILCENYSAVEKALHNKYNFNKINLEWFELTDNDVENFPTLCESINNNINTIKNFKMF